MIPATTGKEPTDLALRQLLEQWTASGSESTVGDLDALDALLDSDVPSVDPAQALSINEWLFGEIGQQAGLIELPGADD